MSDHQDRSKDTGKRSGKSNADQVAKSVSNEGVSISPPPFQLKTSSNNLPLEENSKPEEEVQFKAYQFANSGTGDDQPNTNPNTNNSTEAPFQLKEKANEPGLPFELKSGIENLSGYSMDDVNVHYNSDKPAQLNAYAYAQGTDIHLGPGQEIHLPHEAWHVVQQKQGRVQPTKQLKSNVNVNDDESLEKEVDQMGDKSFQMKTTTNDKTNHRFESYDRDTIQRKVVDDYSALVKPLKKSWNDWAITDRESLRVVEWLAMLSDEDLIDTYNQMQSDGKWDVLYEQAPRDNKDWHDLRWRLRRLGHHVLTNNKKDKRLAKLESALSASKRAVKVQIFLTQDPKVLAKLKEIEGYLGLAASTLEKGMAIDTGTKAIYKISKAASRLNNVREDRYAAAKEFGNLLSSVGELAGLLPVGPLKGYCDLLASSKDFFFTIAKQLEPIRGKGGGRFDWMEDKFGKF